MSLLGNRGRFSSDKNKLNIDFDLNEKSELSSIGKNPISFVKNREETSTNDNDLKSRLLNTFAKRRIEDDSLHKKYNDTLKNDFKYSYDAFNHNKASSGKKSKFKMNIKTVIAMFAVEIATIALIVFLSPYLRLTKMTQVIPFDPQSVVPEYIDENTVNIMKGYKTVAVFGVDSRNGSVAKGANADVNILINLNVENGDVQLISLYRDLYLSVTDGNLYDKLNSAYRRGGPEGAVKVINKNFDLNIVNFFSFNWKAVADGISLLGGVDLEISKAEYKYMNAFIHETCIATGIDAKNPAAHYIKSTGMQHLDGVQAVAYGRLRLMDSDFQRVDRQKKIISLCLEKAKNIDLNTLRTIIEAVLPQIAYEFDFNEMVSLLRLINNVTITESTACPELSNVVSMEMGSAGMCVVPINLEKAVSKLHSVLFNEDDYKVSDAVRRYSNRISEMRHKHQEENELRKASEERERNLASSSTTSISRKVSSATNSNTRTEIASASVVPIISNSEETNNGQAESEGTSGDNNTSESEVSVQVGVSPSDDVAENRGQPESVNDNTGESLSGNPIPIEEETTINATPVPNGPQNNHEVTEGGPVTSNTEIVEPSIVIP